MTALQAGAKDFISRPFDLVEIRTRIRNLLELCLRYKKLESYSRVLEQTVQERTAEVCASEKRFRRLSERASDWYWEQNETREFTTLSGPVLEMPGLRVAAFFGESEEDMHGWNLQEGQALQAMIAAPQPFLDFPFSRTNTDGSRQSFRVSGEPMFNTSCRFVGLRGIGVETAAHA